ncbi:DUF2975 domain-containing protein [Chryseobacterium antibioticum]|uniref:DUF2975 domain-containing protein n=1 Tax=Chryseobacterium antibioticum TaxID=2728847 RepID=UPI0037434D04
MLYLFFFSVYKIFNGLTKDILFNPIVIKCLRRFSWLSFIYATISICNWYYNPISTYFHVDNYIRDYEILLTAFIILIFGVIVLFIVEFFKKGVELQNQTDLTI